jgi:hypothetical protein
VAVMSWCVPPEFCVILLHGKIIPIKRLHGTSSGTRLCSEIDMVGISQVSLWQFKSHILFKRHFT